MITKNDLSAVKLSPTKKDYYQVWNELLETAKKLSERWDPTSTNESDPGIILLKVLTAVADKLNYNIDKNILEAFMPSAAQEESMRKLCDMMGYNIKYYQSATTDVTFSYLSSSDMPELPSTGLVIPQFTAVTNSDQDIHFVTLEPITLSPDNTSLSVTCMEGQLVQCETDEDNIISMAQIDDKMRYYLPEIQIAENGIFIYNISDGALSSRWAKVENLNTQKSGTLSYKFGFDSKLSRPYVQFPEDLAQIIEDGLLIYYLRTSGVNGNVSARTLTTFEAPTTDAWTDGEYSVSQFNVNNASAAVNGTNVETITQAYDNFKKTVGTFDTLVTCRDYMNKIYQLTTDAGRPLVSNCIVSDIRDDINKAQVLCSFNDYGICYLEQAIKNETTSKDLIEHFDLILYPFTTVYGLNNYKEFVDSFKYTSEPVNEIKADLQKLKTISHIFKVPEKSDVVCIKVYLKLNTQITTTYKVNVAEEAIILANIKEAIYKDFNMRKLDFGEEIPIEKISECIENADSRIKNINTLDLGLYYRFVTADGIEHRLGETEGTGNVIYNKLALRNILAGRIQLFNYNTDFKYDFSEASYPSSGIDPETGGSVTVITNYPTNADAHISKLSSECKIDLTPTTGEGGLIQLDKNELLRFRAPNLKTILTYPAYVNYFLKLKDNTETSNAKPATFQTFKTFMDAAGKNRWQGLANKVGDDYNVYFSASNTIRNQTDLNNLIAKYGAAFKVNTAGTGLEQISTYDSSIAVYYYFDITIETFLKPLTAYIVKQSYTYVEGGVTKTGYYTGIYRSLGASTKHIIGRLVDANFVKYQLCSIYPSVVNPLTDLYIQRTQSEGGDTYDGLGQDSILGGIAKNAQYTLKNGEYLLTNYTKSNSADSTTGATTTDTVINEYYGPGTTIRPNFNLNDSAKTVLAGGLNWNKTMGYDFTDTECPDGNPVGMLTLGTNEQIEIRELAKVKLSDNPTYLYWILNSSDTEITASKPYTLEDGEYIFYTDANKIDMAYYGAGTVVSITNGGRNPITIKTTSDKTEVSAEDILENGLTAIPWEVFNLNDVDYIELTEYQYINIAEGDKVDIKASDVSFVPATPKVLTSKWQTCITNNTIKYYIDGAATKLPPIDIQVKDSSGNITKLTWEVSSKLNFNIGPNITQTLNKRDSITVTETNGGLLSTYTIKPLLVNNKLVPISIKTNWTCQSSAKDIITEVRNNDGVNISNAMIKVFKDSPVGVQEVGETNTDVVSYPVDIHNVNGTWTSISTKFIKDDYVVLNINVPKKSFGLLMIYVANGSDLTENAYIKTDATPVIFNYPHRTHAEFIADPTLSSSWTWWENGYVKDTVNCYKNSSANKFYKNYDAVTRTFSNEINPEQNKIYIDLMTEEPYTKYTWNGTAYEKITGDEPSTKDYYKYCLRKGINVIKFKTGCVIRLYSDPKQNEVLILSDTDIVKITDKNPFGFNTALLNYQQTGSTATGMTPEISLAYDLWKADPNHQFYYNCLVDSSSAIDLNTALLGTDDAELLSSPETWFDYNNINNKFVIAEIDADYLDTGVRITKASKL